MPHDAAFTMRVPPQFGRRARVLIRAGICEREPGLAAKTGAAHGDVLRLALAVGFDALEAKHNVTREVSDATD